MAYTDSKLKGSRKSRKGFNQPSGAPVVDLTPLNEEQEADIYGRLYGTSGLLGDDIVLDDDVPSNPDIAFLNELDKNTPWLSRPDAPVVMEGITSHAGYGVNEAREYFFLLPSGRIAQRDIVEPYTYHVTLEPMVPSHFIQAFRDAMR